MGHSSFPSREDRKNSLLHKHTQHSLSDIFISLITCPASPVSCCMLCWCRPSTAALHCSCTALRRAETGLHPLASIMALKASLKASSACKSSSRVLDPTATLQDQGHRSYVSVSGSRCTLMNRPSG